MPSTLTTLTGTAVGDPRVPDKAAVTFVALRGPALHQRVLLAQAPGSGPWYLGDLFHRDRHRRLAPRPCHRSAAARRKAALVVGYHSANNGRSPEIFEAPDDPRKHPWPKRILAEIKYGEEFVPCDIDGNGSWIWCRSLVAGEPGEWGVYAARICEGLKAARIAVADVNGDGRPDIVVGEEVMDFDKQVIPRSRLTWFENPPDPRQSPWSAHVIDKVRCAHSVAAADLDGDGEAEVVCGEHDPFWPYRRMLQPLRLQEGGRGGEDVEALLPRQPVRASRRDERSSNWATAGRASSATAGRTASTSTSGSPRNEIEVAARVSSWRSENSLK